MLVTFDRLSRYAKKVALRDAIVHELRFSSLSQLMETRYGVARAVIS